MESKESKAKESKKKKLKEEKNFFQSKYDVSLFCIVQYSLFITCPILEYLKIKTYHKYKIPINNTVEYLYFYHAVFQLISLTLVCCFCCCISNKTLVNCQVSLSAILWIIVPTIYTVRTIYDLGDIPFFCPSNYDYKFPQLRSACQIRTPNFIFMWITSISILFTSTLTLIPEFYHDNKDNEELLE